MARRRKR